MFHKEHAKKKKKKENILAEIHRTIEATKSVIKGMCCVISEFTLQ